MHFQSNLHMCGSCEPKESAQVYDVQEPLFVELALIKRERYVLLRRLFNRMTALKPMQCGVYGFTTLLSLQDEALAPETNPPK